MFSDEEIVERVRTWKRVSAALIARRFKINIERARRIEAIVLAGPQSAEETPTREETVEAPKQPITFVMPKKLFMAARPSRLLPYLALFSTLLFLNLLLVGWLYLSSPLSRDYLPFFDSGSFCRGEGSVAVISLVGELVTVPVSYTDENGYSTVPPLQTVSSDVVSAIERASRDPGINAIVLSIDSPGGSPVAALEIEEALKKTEKPTVALIRGEGLSAAYWAATGARTIFASAVSDVGSIGATASYVDSAEQNKRQGFTYNSLSSGKYKDTGDPNKSLSAEEKDLILRDVNYIRDVFVRHVAENRKKDVSAIESLADGSTVLGEQALSSGLIDKVGGLPEVLSFLSEQTKTKNLLSCEMSQ